MKKMRKFLVTLLCVAMAMGMCACGSKNAAVKEKNFIDTAKEISEIKNGKMTSEMTYKITDKDNTLQNAIGSDTIKILVTGGVKDEAVMEKMSIVIGDKTYDLTDIAVKDKIIYINVSTLIDTVFTLYTDFTKQDSIEGITPEAIKQMIGGDYLKLSKEDIKTVVEYAAAMASKSGTETGIDSTQIDTYLNQFESLMSSLQTYAEIGYEVYMPKFTEKLETVSPAVMGTDGDKKTITINAENIDSLVTKMTEFAKSDVAGLTKTFSDKVKEKLGEKDALYTALQPQLEGLQGKIDEEIAKVDKDEIAKMKESMPNITMTAVMTGKEGSREATVTSSTKYTVDGEQSMTIDMSATSTIKEGTDVTVETPAEDKTVTLVDVMTNIQTMMSGALQ